MRRGVRRRPCSAWPEVLERSGAALHPESVEQYIPELWLALTSSRRSVFKLPSWCSGLSPTRLWIRNRRDASAGSRKLMAFRTPPGHRLRVEEVKVHTVEAPRGTAGAPSPAAGSWGKASRRTDRRRVHVNWTLPFLMPYAPGFYRKPRCQQFSKARWPMLSPVASLFILSLHLA